MKDLMKFSVEELEALRGGFSDSEMVISEEESTNEGDGALFKCCNDNKVSDLRSADTVAQ